MCIRDRQSTTFEVHLIIPHQALAYQTNQTTVMITPHKEGARTAQIQLNTLVTPHHTHQASINTQTQSAPAGTTVPYKLNITNTGNISDTYQIAVRGNNWPTTIGEKQVMPLTETILGPLTIAEIMPVTLFVDIPTDAQPGEADQATLTITSQTDTDQQTVLILETFEGVRAPGVHRVFIPFAWK